MFDIETEQLCQTYAQRIAHHKQENQYFSNITKIFKFNKILDKVNKIFGVNSSNIDF